MSETLDELQFIKTNSKQMKLKFLQEGGPAPAPEQQPQDPMEQIVAMAAQAVQSNDPNLAMQVCQALVQMAEQAAQQVPAPEEAPQEAPAGEPVFGKGGKLVRRISK